MTSIPELQREAAKAATAVTEARDAEAAKAAKVAEERRRRSVEWAFVTIASYPGDLAAASAAVTPALAAFSAAVIEDLGKAPRLYVDVARAMAAANAVAAEFTQARGILRTAGVLPHAGSNRHDPTGSAAPFPTIGGNIALPPFHDLVASTIAAAGALAARLPVTREDPGAFDGRASEAMRRDVLAAEFVISQDLEHLLGMRERYPDKFARSVPPERRADAEAYAATREARGYDAPLPKVIVETTPGAETSDFGPDETARYTLYR